MDDDIDAASVILRVDSNPEAAHDRQLKLAPDGVTVLVPQPNGDPHNPVCAIDALFIDLSLAPLMWSQSVAQLASMEEVPHPCYRLNCSHLARLWQRYRGRYFGTSRRRLAYIPQYDQSQPERQRFHAG